MSEKTVIVLLLISCIVVSNTALPLLPKFVIDGYKIVFDGVNRYTLTIQDELESNLGENAVEQLCGRFGDFFQELKDGEVHQAINVLALLDASRGLEHQYELPTGRDLHQACEAINDQVCYFERRLDNFLDNLKSSGVEDIPDRKSLHCKSYSRLRMGMNLCEEKMLH